VLEDLIGVRFATEQVAKSQRYEHVSWAFFQFGQMLTYKANKVGSMVVEVSAAYTSQRCPKCGTIKKSNRDTHNHEYHCPCGYRSNDDRVAAMNIQQLGTQYVSGVENPKFEKQKANS
jgi:transposase